MNVARPWSRITARDQGSVRHWIPPRGESGASAVEYGLLIAGIAAIIAVAVFAFGGGSTGLFQDSCQTIFADRSAGSCSE